MADADFGYVGGAPGKIDLYVGKEVHAVQCAACSSSCATAASDWPVTHVSLLSLCEASLHGALGCKLLVTFA